MEQRDDGHAGQACPSNRLVTEPSSKTSRTARASRLAIGSTVSLSKRRSSGIGKVSVTTTSLTLEFFNRSTAGPEKIACVAADVIMAAPAANSASAALQMV